MKRFVEFIKEDYNELSKDREMIFDITSRILDEFNVLVILEGSNGFEVNVSTDDMKHFILNPNFSNHFEIKIYFKQKAGPTFVSEVLSFFSNEVHKLIEDIGYEFQLMRFLDDNFYKSVGVKFEYESLMRR